LSPITCATRNQKKLDGLDPIEKRTLLNPGARSREPAGTPRHGSEGEGRRERGEGSRDTLPHVKQRTGMIIFAAAGRISPVAGRVTGTGTGTTGWGFCEVFLYLLLFDFIEMFYFIFSIFFSGRPVIAPKIL